MADAVESTEVPQVAGSNFDAEGTGEVESESLLDQVLADTTRAMRKAPLSYDQIQAVRKQAEGIPVGVLGWWPKVGEVAKNGKVTTAGSRISGQIVSAFSSTGKFGTQQAVIIAGRNVSPKHLNAQGQAVPAIDKVGRWIVGIDSTLTELPGLVGDVVDVQFKIKGGGGKRHEYEDVRVWYIGGR